MCQNIHVRRSSNSDPRSKTIKRRDFMKQASITAAAIASATHLKAAPANPIARRPLGKTGERLSIIGFGGIVVMNEQASEASKIVAEAVDRGVNYFDVAPSYGNAQERLGVALAAYRKNCFLACKTNERMKDDARADLEQSLRLLKTDHLDLYQFHALTKMTDLDKVLGPGGAIETMETARREGKIRYIGFSVHSAETALAAMDRYNFDTILFPVNWVLFSQAGFGPQILKKAQEKKMGILALKGLAKTVWAPAQKHDHPEPKCWYRPAAFPEEASLGLRWTLSHPITAAIPPGDERYFRLAMDVAQNFMPLQGMRSRPCSVARRAWNRCFTLATTSDGRRFRRLWICRGHRCRGHR
jgi:aryl-alcohol dehydrogenase-like predicted oxidoreductase